MRWPAAGWTGARWQSSTTRPAGNTSPNGRGQLFGDVMDERDGGFPAQDSARYSEQLGRGAVFLVVTVADGQAVRVEELMRRGGAQRVQAPSAAAGDAVDEGGPRVRVYTHTMERPVEEHIRLREHRVGGQRSWPLRVSRASSPISSGTSLGRSTRLESPTTSARPRTATATRSPAAAVIPAIGKRSSRRRGKSGNNGIQARGSASSERSATRGIAREALRWLPDKNCNRRKRG